jgi:hypothetical protein
MPRTVAKRRYILLRANNQNEIESVQEAIAQAQSQQKKEPHVTFLVVQIVATVAAAFDSKVARHY